MSLICSRLESDFNFVLDFTRILRVRLCGMKPRQSGLALKLRNLSCKTSGIRSVRVALYIGFNC